jgi:uncharacterized protein (TIGR02444 family)
VSASLDLENPFWRFSLAVYARPGVEGECLAAQNAFNLDANMLLFCAWTGAARGLRVDAEWISVAMRAVEPWHSSVVRPLRALRQRLKTLPEFEDASVKALRKQIAADELRAEQIEQALLYELVASLPNSDDRAGAGEILRDNIAAYLQLHAADHVCCDRLRGAAIDVASAV